MTSEDSSSNSVRHQFLVDTYETEIVKVLSTWSMFDDGDLPLRPHPTDARGRSVHEQMVHQCISENLWFESMLGISVSRSPLPRRETRQAFIKHYREVAQERLAILRSKSDAWWAGERNFFEVRRSRAWIMTRRMTHTAHHRGQQTTMLRGVRPRPAQHVWSDERYRRPDAKPCSGHLPIHRHPPLDRGGILDATQDTASGARRTCPDGTSGTGKQTPG